MDFLDVVQEPTYPPELDEQVKWMGAVGKTAFAPWGDRNHPDGEEGKDARWKWGIEDNYVDGATVDDWIVQDPRIEARAFIQQEGDPYAIVDGDNGRDPETGDVHPGFVVILEHLGLTYADISTSGAGVHAHYKGEVPIEGEGQPNIRLDTEAWGSNETPPTVEFYANTHLSITRGAKVEATPAEVVEWDEEVLRAILLANGYQDKDPISHDTDDLRSDIDDYNTTATDVDDTTDDIRDVLKAADRLRPGDLPLETETTGKDATGWQTFDPSYRTSESGESLHMPSDEAVFYDHAEGEAFGVLGLFAAEEG